MIYKFTDIISDVRTGLNPRQNFTLGSGDNFYITIKNFSNNKIYFDDKADKISDEAIKLINKRSRLKKGDILFASIGRIGDMAIIDEAPSNWNVNESVFVFTPNLSLVLPKYIYYLFKSSNVREFLNKNSSGSTFKSIKMNRLKEMKFDIPDIDTQDRIIAILDHIYEAYHTKNKEIKLLDELVKSRFNEMFDCYKKNNQYALKDFCELITKGTTPTTLGYQFIEDGINFVKVESITKEHKFLKNKFLHISEECNEKLKRSILKENDILFSIAGAIGRTAIVSKDILPANTNQALAIIRLKDDISLNHIFLNYLLNSDYIKVQCESKKVGAAQINLSLTDIGSFKIFIPSLDKQNEFAEFVKLINKSKVNTEKQVNILNEMLEKEMEKYFN